MKSMIRIEIERMRSGRTFWASLLVGIIIITMQIFFETVQLSVNPLKGFMGANTYPYTLYTSWIGVHHNAFMYVFLFIFPILAAMAHAITYYTDYKGGYIKNIITKTNKKNYLLAKYYVTFFSGGIVVVFPMVANFVITAAMLPAIKPFVGSSFIHSRSLLAPLAYYHPFFYFLLFMLLYFIYGGIFACLALTGSYFVKNSYLLTLFPFIIWYGIGAISKNFEKIPLLLSFDPNRMLNMSNSYTTYYSIIGEALILLIISFSIYYWKGIKSDVI